MSGLSREDRARVEGVIRDYLNAYGFGSPTYENAMALTRALALIDQQEKALEAADELEREVRVIEASTFGRVLQHPALGLAADVYRSARSTSTKEDG